MLGRENMSENSLERIFKALDMTVINTIFVKHCPNAFGVAFTHQSGYKITYSGDTMPSDNLVKLGFFFLMNISVKNSFNILINFRNEQRPAHSRSNNGR